MIKTKQDLKEFIDADISVAWRSQIFRRDILKYLITLRKLEYWFNKPKRGIMYYLYRYLWARKSILLGLEIPPNTCGKGLRIEHGVGLFINGNARIGNFAVLHQCVTIGNDGHSEQAPQIGDYCYIGAGAVILGDVSIGDRCTIGAGAVVTKSFPHDSILVGIPAKNINNDK